MRILRLDLGQALGTVDLHPFVSIVHGLEPEQRTAFTDAVRSLARGNDRGIGGLVEDGGRLIELPGLDTGSLNAFTTEDISVNVDGVGVGADRLPALRAELDQLRRKAQIDAVHVEEIRADLSPSALATVRKLEAALSGTNPASEAALRRHQSIERLQVAAEALATLPPSLRETPQEVAPMIERWEAYTARLAEVRPHLESLTKAIQTAEADLMEAHSAVQAAEAAAVPLRLDPSEDARIDQISEIMFDPRAKKKQWNDELEAELNALLAKVGQPTYTAYAMYRMSPEVPAEARTALEQARAHLAVTEQAVETARSNYEYDPVAGEINTEFDALKDDARQHLGAMLPEDLGGALAALVVERENPEWRGAFDHLRAEFADVGGTLDPQYESDPTVVARAVKRWIDDALAEDDNGPSPAELEAQLAEAEKVFARHARAMARIDRLEAVAAESARTVVELRERIAQIESGHEAPTDVFASVQALADRVRTESGSACPLILEGEFADLDDTGVAELLERCETLGQQLQLIVVSNRPAAANWAQQVGLRRALRSTMISAGV